MLNTSVELTVGDIKNKNLDICKSLVDRKNREYNMQNIS